MLTATVRSYHHPSLWRIVNHPSTDAIKREVEGGHNLEQACSGRHLLRSGGADIAATLV